MALTYVLAGERDRLTDSARTRTWQPHDTLLAAASGIAILAVLLATLGRLQTLDRSGTAVATVDLNAVANAAQLEGPLAAAIADAATREGAARELFRFVSEQRRENGPLQNVGALARAAGVAAASDGTQRIVPIVTSAQLAAAKPFLSVRSREAYRNAVFWSVALYVLAFHLVALLWRVRGIDADRVLLSAVHVLTAIGFALLISRSDPLRDSLLFARYAQATVLGVAVMAAVSLVDFKTARFLELSYLPLAAALLLSVALIAFGSGPGTSRAKVNLGPMQPIEAIRLLLALFLAGYFARRWELLRGLRGTTFRDVAVPRWLDIPRGEDVLPVVVGVAAALLLFFIQRDLGPALFLSCVFLAVYAVARGRIGLALGGLAVLVAGFYVGYRLDISSALAARVEMWQSPWDNRVGGGNQVAHAMWALATGGVFGTGLGLGDGRYLPAGHTDLVLAAIGEELGLVGLLLVATLLVVVAWRGLRIARLASNDYAFFLATTLTLFLIVPALIMGMGITGLAPLTGVVTPFLSYGGSAMVANFAAIGILASIHAERRGGGVFAPFARPVRWLRVTLAVPAVGLLVVFMDAQIVRADEYVARPHLGVQADGGRRFEYNPRLLDVARELPRGTIYDRDGLALSSADPRVIAAAQKGYERFGVSLRNACARQDQRCYPLGGRAFHLLGDARSRSNWSAANTSYVERDAEDTLRGFDDHARAVEVTGADGKPMSAVRRDYRDLVPVLRHRYDTGHPAVVAAHQKPRDITLTIDARLQHRTAEILRAYAAKTSGKAAAVVLDPDTGELLAVASFPWPSLDLVTDKAPTTPPVVDAFLDRARYGLYPPGSTFKLVTAAAALREDRALTTTDFTCSRLADGRTGARVGGWSRPVRDDVLDTHPHGRIRMHEGLVHSCNAYFAQLGARLGVTAIEKTAAQLGISLTPAKDARDRVRDTLPQVAYGQADVLATPLRMARVAAAIAADGVLREPVWRKRDAQAPAESSVFLDPTAARLLASYMRDAVTSGTGRVLRSHPARIAGKTGTAELAGQPSHSWFVGYAPHGPASKRIAFAVIVENAGYGALAAAPAAGEIVSAAAAAGLIK